MISVIIPTRSRPDLLGEALASLRDQTFTDFEAVVINDGGPSLEEVVRPWRQHLPLTLVGLPDPGGVSRARNAGIGCAGGEYLAFLDDDDVFLPHHLETAHKVLTSGPLDFVYLGALVSGRRLRRLPGDLSGMHTKAYAFDDRFLLVANYIHTGSVVVRNFHRSEDNHAALVETSLLMHVAPGAVREHLLTDDDSPRRVRYLILPAPDDVKTQAGVIYQAKKATSAIGRRLIPEIVGNLVDAVRTELTE